MVWNPFKIISKRFLGIDIGTSFIKIVELSSLRGRRMLENYGEVSALSFYEKPFRAVEKNTLSLSSKEIAKAILAILDEANIKTRQVCLSIPDFSSFYTSFELPAMSKEEIPEAVKFEARQHIPLPLSDVTFDWQVIKRKVANQEDASNKILLVAVPNEVVNQYRAIANLLKLNVLALEAEVFGLVRSLIKNKGIIGLIDIGAQSTTISVIEEKTLISSHSFDISGNEFTDRIAKVLSVEYKEAEELKKNQGLTNEGEVKKILTPIVDLVLIEAKRISQDFYQVEGKKIEKFILAGGSALLPGLREYLFEGLNKEVEIADPFSDIFYPSILKTTIKEMGPGYAIAVGMALRGLE